MSSSGALRENKRAAKKILRQAALDAVPTHYRSEDWMKMLRRGTTSIGQLSRMVIYASHLFKVMPSEEAMGIMLANQSNPPHVDKMLPFAGLHSADEGLQDEIRAKVVQRANYGPLLKSLTSSRYEPSQGDYPGGSSQGPNSSLQDYARLYLYPGSPASTPGFSASPTPYSGSSTSSSARDELDQEWPVGSVIHHTPSNQQAGLAQGTLAGQDGGGHALAFDVGEALVAPELELPPQIERQPPNAMPRREDWNPHTQTNFTSGGQWMQQSLMGLKSNMRDADTGVYNTLEPYDRYTGTGMLRYVLGETVVEPQWLDFANRNLMYQNNLPGVFPPHSSRTNTMEVLHLQAGVAGKNRPEYHPWEEGWPVSSEYAIRGHGKLRLSAHF